MLDKVNHKNNTIKWQFPVYLLAGFVDSFINFTNHIAWLSGLMIDDGVQKLLWISSYNFDESLVRLKQPLLFLYDFCADGVMK